MTKEGMKVADKDEFHASERSDVNLRGHMGMLTNFVTCRLPNTPFSLGHTSTSATCPLTFPPSPGLSFLQIPPPSLFDFYRLHFVFFFNIKVGLVIDY